MAQYHAIKQAHPGALLFYRMGDFYEIFFDDAVQAARALDIALTKRGKHNGEDIPMCGVPVHAAEAYLARLIKKGFRVAVCEQMEDPAEAKKRGAKSVVKRDVVRLVTPGTITEDSLLDSKRNNFLAALADAAGTLGLAWLDLSTGEFVAQSLEPEQLPAALARIAPGELLIADKLLARPDIAAAANEGSGALTPRPSSLFDSENARRRLQTLYDIAALDAFGSFGRAELAAAGALVDYVELTQKGRLPAFAPLRQLAARAVMEIDAATRRNLELIQGPDGGRDGSLLAVIDRTMTGAGARLLSARLAAPLTNVSRIRRRHDAVGFFVQSRNLREDVRAVLGRLPDMARALSRLGVGRGGPRDLAAIRDALAAGAALRRRLESPGKQDGFDELPSAIANACSRLGTESALVDLLARALTEELPLLARDGGFLAMGFDHEFDEAKSLRDDSRKLIAGLEGRYAEAAGIPGLKIKHNNVLGYFIETRPNLADKVAAATGPEGQERFFIHRQTIASAVRFTTPELAELETKISRAADRALALELKAFDDLCVEVRSRAAAIGLAAQAIATLDVSSALAELAVEQRWARPVVDDSLAFNIKGGRHPVVEAALAREAAGSAAFVANDCDMSASKLWLITGPNMAGKSTFLRQNAVIAILAQAGAYVPAESATIGAVDRLFSRVGAADDLARGRSTFMVEMVETAAILNQSGERALVILDEIGRGTATYDGLSIAWATIEHLHDINKCRALFATHYHELTQLSARLAQLSNHSMRIKEWQGNVVFLHEVGPGAADRSYGIHVAKLAGLPAAALLRAEEVLANLESGGKTQAVNKLSEDLPLFSATVAAAKPQAPAEPSEIERKIERINPDDLTPRGALDLLYELRGLLKD
ncbi:MAG TPA: DNA mismatch repair protein MutS [Alphaproteobacteria bacterium]|nr:DNA mismatch repair protein MutS [Alphaproteobacteria bacterium]